MLCAPRQVIVVFIGAVFFVDFYTKDGSEEWTRVLKNALGDIGLSLTAPSLRGFFSPRLVFGGISWPWSLPFRSQVILIAGIIFLGIEYAQAAWRVAYYKLLHGEWGSSIKPLSEGVKRRAALSLALGGTRIMGEVLTSRSEKSLPVGATGRWGARPPEHQSRESLKKGGP